MKPSQDFWEKFGLLLATAALTGLLAPLVLKEIEDSKARELRTHEAALARQSKVIDAQSQFLEDLSEAAWKWRYLSMKVISTSSFEKIYSFDAAVSEYRVNIWSVLSRLRHQASKARWLVSEASHLQLVALYDEIVAFDSSLELVLIARISVEERSDRLTKLHEQLRGPLTRKIDTILDQVARETKLRAQ